MANVGYLLIHNWCILMAKSRPSIEERCIFCVWYYETYHKVLSQREATELLTNGRFVKKGKYQWEARK